MCVCLIIPVCVCHSSRVCMCLILPVCVSFFLCVCVVLPVCVCRSSCRPQIHVLNLRRKFNNVKLRLPKFEAMEGIGHPCYAISGSITVDSIVKLCQFLTNPRFEDLAASVSSSFKLSPTSVFWDIGSGDGNVLLSIGNVRTIITM